MKNKIKLHGALKHYLCWPVYLAILLIIVTAFVLFADVRAGLISALGTAVYILIAALVFRRFDPKIINDLVAFSQQYGQVENRILQNLEFPYALLDSGGKLIWGNSKFSEVTGCTAFTGVNIESIFPEISVNRLPSWETGGVSESVVTQNDRIFRVRMEQVEIGDLARKSEILKEVEGEIHLTVLYLHDETELRSYIQQCEDEKPVVGVAYLDNYDEALQSVEDVRRSLLIALIDRKITRYFSEFGGLVKKTEKDKYLILLKKESLEILKTRKFNILDEVKTVNIGNEMSVTLSIGIGLNGSDYLQDYEYSRIAIEMALGRGGDQAVVRDGTSISYYGGKALQMEKNTRVKARVKAQALKEFISSKDSIIVMGHKITDVDALGAAIGIYRAAKTLGKSVHIVVNDPTTSIRPLMAGFIDSPEYEPNLFVDSTHARELVDNNTAVIVVDTNKPSYTECPELLQLSKTIIVLDHHRRGSEVIENAVLSYVEPYASSTCEMVSEILQYFYEGLKLRNIEADCLYAGIIIDTNNFTTRAGVRTFEAAAYLRRNGADVTRVRKMLRDNIDSYKARAEAVRNAEIYQGFFAIGKCPSEGLESPTVVGAQAANELLNINGVKASFVLTAYNDEVYISARAIDEVNVQVLMEKLGGGGHLNIAGAQVRASVDEAEKMLKEIIDEAVSPQEQPAEK
ncbi:MAG: DHH family phosphoesterase [Blautia sp.]|nr:DHH family phosphoesterase [Blautia sp.]